MSGSAVNLPPCFRVIRGWWPVPVEPLGAVVPWVQPTVRIFGSERPTPRLTCWYGREYAYSGSVNAPAPMPAWVREIADAAEVAAGAFVYGARFNSVLLNYYRDGRDSVAWHADDEPELGDEPIIASLSLGAPRRFSIRRRTNHSERSDVDLGGGDLLVMHAESQRDYLHSVPKTAREVGPRINLTFRWIG